MSSHADDERFELYKPRRVEFNHLATTNGWDVKVYTITNRLSFESTSVLSSAVARLQQWLAEADQLGLPTYQKAFLIVHEGRDGVWSLISWWIGGEMLQSTTYFTSFEDPGEFKMLPPEGFLACVWEMAVICFERAMWIEYVLKQAEKPNFTSYLAMHLSKEI